ncbi:hypothetical protein GY45DRAFT_1323899 [Cubamyces sp. BRFM 1775]|nr:hypothetical protein GY45DRAFT_1323899 [Cubamyces sp. BRFM 1775]
MPMTAAMHQEVVLLSTLGAIYLRDTLGTNGATGLQIERPLIRLSPCAPCCCVLSSPSGQDRPRNAVEERRARAMARTRGTQATICGAKEARARESGETRGSHGTAGGT